MSAETLQVSTLYFAYPRHHGMDGGEMGLARRTTVDTLARQVLTIAHAHGDLEASSKL